MRALDLYCGLGGWSDGLAMEGFEVLGVEINQEIADLYKHPVIVDDVRNLDGHDFRGYDLIVGSPPCNDFSRINRIFKRNKPNIERGLELVSAFLSFVSDAEPSFWIMENVPELTNYISLKPRLTTKLGRRMKRSFWGKFPPFLVTRDYKAGFIGDVFGIGNKNNTKLKQWERARIPIPFARGLGRAVRSSLGSAKND